MGSATLSLVGDPLMVSNTTWMAAVETLDDKQKSKNNMYPIKSYCNDVNNLSKE